MAPRVRTTYRKINTPSTIRSQVGEMRSSKGSITGDHIQGTKEIFSWDAVPNCLEMDCPAYDVCTFPNHSDQKCGAIMQYAKGVQDLMFKNFVEVMDEPSLFRIGMHLSPLYIMLAKFKITELGVRFVMETNPKTGSRNVHPIYREIRETIKMIEATWKSIGIDPKGIEIGTSENVVDGTIMVANNG